MVGDMEYLKIKVNNDDESKEIQELLFEFGCYWAGRKNKDNVIEVTNGRYIFSRRGEMTYCESSEVELNGVGFSLKEITLQQLRDLVVLKRNSVDDATHYYGCSKYYLTDSGYYQYSENKWVNIDEYIEGLYLKLIEKEVKMEKKEYLVKTDSRSYLYTKNVSDIATERVIEVPEGAEIFLLDKSCGEDTLYFVKHDGEVFHEYYIDSAYVPNNTWIKGTVIYLHKGMGEVLWKRNTTKTLESNNNTTKEKLKFIEKWLNGEKIQYILGNESEKTQWHNFTEGAMQYIKRSDIKFREAPKYVTINGIEFKNVESLLKHVKNNFDLEDGE